MKKSNRQLAIKQIINNYDIATQEELLHYLKKEGVEATQATISRDIKEMHLVKTTTSNGNVKYTLFQNNKMSNEEKLQSTLGEVVIKLTRVQFMTILMTIPGNAHVIGALMDAIDFPEKVGTIAGNDTCLIISKNEEEAIKMYDYLHKWVNE
ncbi:MAG: arginine repressor [Carnobacterium sp.]|uniref:Arginine repressor n=1 Tax=Carnobacterium antarcticum TaxID=2126436 RepID=A0ABW4NPH5_9LACT|nr:MULTISPECIES: arginine repressor [unclassified Carnobacterium]ALV21319.1 Arginine pathway regulatory protein ArgR, repressor of arg regulon [Carnobacterium sp. CP1]QQP69341.1 arginine repressor [Carnobacterium sp. CS13]